MKKIYSTYLLFFVFCSLSYGQTNSQLLRAADDAFVMTNYAAAAKFYKQVIYNIDSGTVGASYPYGIAVYNPPPSKKNKVQNQNDSTSSDKAPDNVKKDDRTYAMERVALSYSLLRSNENAEIWYKQLYDIDHKTYCYDYANSMRVNEKYEKAIEIGNALLPELEIGSAEYNKLRDLVKSCAFAVQTIKNTNEKIIIKELDASVNGTTGAFAANYGNEPGSILFSSVLNTGTPYVEGQEKPIDCNIYKVMLRDGGKTDGESENVSQFVNTSANEAAGVFSPDKTKLYFTRWEYTPDKQECAIYVSKFFNGQWLTARKLNNVINAPGSKSMHPALSPDGKTLYFASDRPGGFGKLDIWYCQLDEKDDATEALNAGKAINTTEDEISPYYHPNNYLYFSSTGHPGLGGFDIFKVQFENNKFWPPAKNLSSPINSSKDDAYYISNPEAQIGFFSSDRKKCEECGEGRCYHIYYFEDKPIIITISGRVYNEQTNEPVPNSLIEFIDVSENYDPIYAFTDENGNYKTELIRDIEYFATAQKKGFFKAAVNVSTMGINVSTDIIQDFNFVLPPIPKTITIPGIEYDYDSYALRDKSKLVLDTLADLLFLNDNFVIKINSHTDERGNDAYNLKLSIGRAKSVVDYLILKGIEPERLQSEGFGETNPLFKNATTEEEHQKNRRTEFEVIGQDYQSTDKLKYLRKTRSEEP